MEPICGINKIDPARRNLRCIICKKGGACIQCVEGKCTIAYHPICALEADFEMTPKIVDDALQFNSYCERHRHHPPKYKKRSFIYTDKLITNQIKKVIKPLKNYINPDLWWVKSIHISSNTKKRNKTNVTKVLKQTTISSMFGFNVKNSATSVIIPPPPTPIATPIVKDDGGTYCICRTGWNNVEFMIACDQCGEWFHGLCVDILPNEGKLIEKYFCAKCINDPNGNDKKIYIDNSMPWYNR